MSEQTKPSKPDSRRSYSVGYGRPPEHTRFQRGQSGNPKGREKGQRNIRSIVADAVGQRVKIREGNRTHSRTKLEAFALTLVNAALKGDPKAQASLINLMRSLGMMGEPPAVSEQQPFTADDDGVIADFLRRRGLELQPKDIKEDSTEAGGE